ncbi:MAG: mandelate racemase/muconate lactonizing enzyme family protein [Gemmatimonadota bacterium]|nr:mandelate racemase/muconate lactonizing enzyme family protein [Gemmatimonadota bacterium]
MKITGVDVFIYKHPQHYMLRGVEETPGRIKGTDYFFEPHWRQSYSRQVESCLVKVTTDNGLEGWGEAQAPIMPEMAGTIIQRLFGPILLGRDPLEREWVYDQLYHINNVRGHGSGFAVDAIAALDIALWDIAGRHYGVPVYELMGGACWKTLPAYVSGLREPTLDEQGKAARGFVERGFGAIKIFLGHGIKKDIHAIRTIREAVGPDVTLYCDLLWRYRLDEAVRIGRVLDEEGYEWLEAPLAPEDIPGHRILADTLDVPVAVGEPLRTVYEFLPWFEQRALEIAQPDLVRTGFTAAKKIAGMAEAFRIPLAPHIGVCTGIGMAATWQFAITLPNLLIQEYQIKLMDGVTQLLNTSLEEKEGRLIVPDGPGLGVEVNEEVVQSNTTEHWSV